MIQAHRSHRWLALFITIMMAAVLSLAMFGTAAGDEGDCPTGQGYWKNHESEWPVTELTIAGQVYTQAEVLAILNSPTEGDASLILARQLIAAQLNIASGQDAAVASSVIQQAETLLAAYPGKLPFNVAPSSTDGSTMTALGSVLDAYNNGALTPGCIAPTLTPTPEATGEATPEATPEGTPEATPEATPDDDDDLPITIVIEGPVTAININIITIFDIDIQLSPDDPNLNIIQIGDIVRVEGDTSDLDGTTIIVIAINVVIINVDINVDTGEVWRDDGGNCGNPPPPWAPANGWRRRCEGNNGGGGDDDDDDD